MKSSVLPPSLFEFAEHVLSVWAAFRAPSVRVCLSSHTEETEMLNYRKRAWRLALHTKPGNTYSWKKKSFDKTSVVSVSYRDFLLFFNSKINQLNINWLVSVVDLWTNINDNQKYIDIASSKTKTADFDLTDKITAHIFDVKQIRKMFVGVSRGKYKLAINETLTYYYLIDYRLNIN